MITDKLKDLNNTLNEKIDNIKQKNLNNFSNNLNNEIKDIERQLLEEKLFQLERKAFLYIANNNLNTQQDIRTLRRLLVYIERTHERQRNNKCMVKRVENLLEGVVKKNISNKKM